MFDQTPRGWAVACLVGFGTLFVAFSLADVARLSPWLSAWPDPAALPSVDPATGFGGVDPQVAAELYWTNAVYHFVHITVFGALIGWLQTKVLPAHQVHTLSWVLLTALGFASIFVFEALRPGIVSGGHPAPIEPLLIGVGGGGLAGLFQWLYLRRREILAARWLALWIAGLCAGAALAALLLTLVGFLGPLMRTLLSERWLFSVSQFVFYVVYGPTVGAIAGLMSGRALMEALEVIPDGSAA